MKAILKRKPTPIKDFDYYKRKFMQLRKQMNELYIKIDDSSDAEDEFFNKFSEVLEQAKKNDSVAQDYLSYIYKRGLDEYVLENYKNSMDWLFFAGANGNTFSMSKLKIFFSQSLSEIYSLNDIEEIAVKTGDPEGLLVFEEYLIKNLCDSMLDYLNVDTKKLAKRKSDLLESSVLLNQEYESARAKSLNAVIEFLRK